VRFGARLLRLNPGFAVVAIASLALGSARNTRFSIDRCRAAAYAAGEETRRNWRSEDREPGLGTAASQRWHPT